VEKEKLIKKNIQEKINNYIMNKPVSSYEILNSEDSINSENELINLPRQGNYHTILNKHGFDENRYVFMNEIIKYFNYKNKSVLPIYDTTLLYKQHINEPHPLTYYKDNFNCIIYPDDYHEDIPESITIIEDVTERSIKLNRDLERITRGIVFVIGNIYHSTVLILDLDSNNFYNVGFGHTTIIEDQKEFVKPGTLYSVDMFIPDYNHEAKIVWVQELTRDVLDRIQIELNKIDKIHYLLKETDDNKWEIIQNTSLLGRSLIKYLKAENIYNLESKSSNPPFANCLRWAFHIIGQTQLLTDPRIKFCGKYKKSTDCRFIRNRLWEKLRNKITDYLKFSSSINKERQFENIVRIMNEIQYRLRRLRKKTQKQSVIEEYEFVKKPGNPLVGVSLLNTVKKKLSPRKTKKGFSDPIYNNLKRFSDPGRQRTPRRIRRGNSFRITPIRSGFNLRSYMNPRSPRKPDIQLSPRKPDIQLSPRKSDIQLSPRKPDIQLSPRKPDIQLSPRVNIGFDDNDFDDIDLDDKGEEGSFM
jgi:hypothetical protein